MFYNKNNQSTDNHIDSWISIAAFVSTAIAAGSLAYHNVIATRIAILIILGSVAFIAIGSNKAKIVLMSIALFLFVLYYSGSDLYFPQIVKQMLELTIVLACIYIMIRSTLRKK